MSILPQSISPFRVPFCSPFSLWHVFLTSFLFLRDLLIVVSICVEGISFQPPMVSLSLLSGLKLIRLVNVIYFCLYLLCPICPCVPLRCFTECVLSLRRRPCHPHLFSHLRTALFPRLLSVSLSRSFVSVYFRQPFPTHMHIVDILFAGEGRIGLFSVKFLENSFKFSGTGPLTPIKFI